MSETTATNDCDSEALLALQDYMNMRDLIGEYEAQENCCSCDANNFHTCGYCDDLRGKEVELRRLQNVWADRWIGMLALSNKVQGNRA